MADYNFYPTNITRNKEGVGIYVKKQYNCKHLQHLCSNYYFFESVFVECMFSNEIVTIGSIYHRPGTSFENFKEKLAQTLNQIPNRCVLMGDFNINSLNVNNDIQVTNFVNLMNQQNALNRRIGARTYQLNVKSDLKQRIKQFRR